MKWSMSTVGVIILGLIGVSIILLFQGLTTNSENDYYLLKEITEASMFDAIDYKVYRESGELKIRKEAFVESFTRRFAESTLFIGSSYTIKMFDIIETPPKVTIFIDTGIGSFTIHKYSDEYNVTNYLSGILEYNNQDLNLFGDSSIFYHDEESEKSNENPGYVKRSYTKDYYSIMDDCNTEFKFEQILNIPDILNVKGGLVKINSVNVVEGPNIIIGEEDIINNITLALLYRELDWVVTPKSTKYDNWDYYNVNKYYKNSLTVQDLSVKLCSSDTGCNGIDTYKLTWNGKINGAGSLLVKYKIKWNYEIKVYN